MGDCSYCGDADVLTRTCNRCGTETCSEHLLPENHDCAGLTHSQTNSRYLQSEVDAKLGNDTAASHDTSNHTQTSTPANTNTAEVDPNYDSSPDVAPDGSLAEQEKLTTDQPTSETNASRSLSTYLQTIRQRLSNRNSPRPITPLRTATTLFKFALLAGIIITVAGFATGNVSLDERASEVAGTLGNASDDATGSPINESRVEAEFIQYLNEERTDRGLQNVSQRKALSAMGRNHSGDMVERDYFSHTNPNGDTIEDRYRENGLLPECRLPVQGTDEYYPGAENIAQTYWHQDVTVDWAAGGTYHASTSEELAWMLFQIWMHSDEHREAMLVASADEAGLGLAVTDSNKVYASLELC